MHININDLILGGGAAGLILGNIFNESLIIDKNPLGQLNTPFIPGPRIFKNDKLTLKFLKKFTSIKNIDINPIFIGYIDQNNEEINILSQSFKEEYSFITRGTRKVEKSFLSSGESVIETLSDGSENFYQKVFVELFDNCKNRIIEDNVLNINSKSKIVTTKLNDMFSYSNCYSTLNMKIFLKLIDLDEDTFKLETNKKHFVQCEYTNKNDVELAKKYSYVYSINNLYTRKTFFKDYIVYELTDAAVLHYSTLTENFQKDFLISTCDGNFTINKIFNLPFQITQSIDVNMIHNVNLIGRYAQWNHNVKANEIINKFYE
jgi:hypothetical protein